MEHPTGLAVSERLPAGQAERGLIVVLVHGSLDRSTSFGRVLRRLEDLHTVVYDRRGYHRSRHALPVRTTLDGHVEDLLAVIDGRPSVVVGHSYGGTIALAAALRRDPFPTIAAVAAYEPPMPWLPGWPNRGGTDRGGAVGVDPDQEAERFFRRVVGSDAWDRLTDSARAERRADGPALVAELTAIRVAEAPFDVSRLAVPTLFGRGERSLPHHRQAVGWLGAHVAGSVVVDIPGATHGAHLSHPDAFAALVRRTVRAANSGRAEPSGPTPPTPPAPSTPPTPPDEPDRSSGVGSDLAPSLAPEGNYA